MQVLHHRGQLRSLRTLCEEQEVAIEAWREGTRAELDDSLAVRFNDLLEHVRRVLSHARSMQEATESLVQLHFAMVAHRTNEVMKTLTVVAAIFLPLTLVAGIFGMNFQHMPELGWRYGYAAALAGMVAVAAGLALWFRRRRWI
jgi:magnesium/cobalt transport protein CorA